MSLLVVLEHDRGTPVEANLEAINAAWTLAGDMDTTPVPVIIGDAETPTIYGGSFGFKNLHHITHPMLSDYGPEAYGESVAQLIAATTPTAVIAVGTSRGNEVMAQVAARMDLPFIANCTTVVPADGPWSMTRVQWGGSLLEDATLDSGDGPKLLTIGHHTVAAFEPRTPGAAEVHEFTPSLDESLARTIVQGRDVQEAGVTLSTAPVVVSGGRGVGSAEGFAQLEELAALLGGRIGCSRAVTNLGWRNHTDQVGQTGTRIAPEIYIATGISGAIQHWVGAMASKRILAINTDPEANMVVKADYAVIADLHKVVPAITAEIKRRKGL